MNVVVGDERYGFDVGATGTSYSTPSMWLPAGTHFIRTELTNDTASADRQLTVNSLAVNEPNLNAGVANYGGQPNAEDVPKINAAMMLHYGGLDERINAGIPAYEAALKQAGKTYEIHVYEGANHAFNNDTNEARYDKNAADLAWKRTVAFLKKNLA